jgi:hypothetical protein
MQPNEWQPIATAPQDARRVIVWSPKRLEPSIAYQVFSGGQCCWFEWLNPEALDHGPYPWTPTHWMPLPTPPAIEGESQ